LAWYACSRAAVGGKAVKGVCSTTVVVKGAGGAGGAGHVSCAHRPETPAIVAGMPLGKYFNSLWGMVAVSKVPEHTARTMSVGWLASGPMRLAH
jgi:hypothetical protein